MSLWQEIDRHVRAHAKVACLTQNVQVMDGGHAEEALRGYARLSLWAHYGASGTGVCLGFDQRTLVESFMTAPDLQDTLRFHGPVQYRHASAVPVRGLNMGQIKEFGVDAAALAFAEDNRETVFFRKHADWANEAEYRLVLIDQSVLPAAVTIRSALTHIVLGECFPDHKRPALAAALADCPHVEVRQMRFHNRAVFCEHISLDDTTCSLLSRTATSSGVARRSGSLKERLRQLRMAEQAHRADAEHAQQLTVGLLGQMTRALAALTQLPPDGAHAQLLPRIDAVPEHLRRRAADVPGEVVRFEQGLTVLVEDIDDPYRLVMAAAAVQVLSEHRLRIHGCVRREEPDPTGVKRIPVWNDSRDTHANGAASVTAELLDDLHHAFFRARQAFEKTCGLPATSATPPSTASTK